MFYNKFIDRVFLCMMFLFVLFSGPVSGAGGGVPTGARAAGMGRSSVALQGFWSVQNNQAGMALFKGFAAGIDYDSRFLNGNLSTKNLALLVPVKFGVAGLSFNYYGYKFYNEFKAGMAYARAFGPALRIGLQLDYLQITLGDNYGKKQGVTFEIGIQSDVTERLTLGLWAYNPLMIHLAGFADERIASVFRFGMVYRFSSVLLTTVEAEKRSDYQPVILRGGFEYVMQKRFIVRMGFGTDREIFSLGFGLKFKQLRFDLAAVMHQSLGFSPEAGLLFEF